MLARGLSYLRASNRQVMRLHLAMEQQDRRGVMAAIDELVGLDRELARFVESVPDPALASIGREIEAQKRDVMEQRMVLARGKIGPSLVPAAEPAFRRDPPPDDELMLEPAPLAVAPVGFTGEDRPLRRRRVSRRARWPWVLAVLFLLLAAAAAYLWFVDRAMLDLFLSRLETLR